MEVRSIARSGPTAIPQVQASRDAFLGQDLMVERGVWDRYLFDNNPDTYYRLSQFAIWGGAFRLDMGKPTPINQWVMRNVDQEFKPEEAFVSVDLKNWTRVPLRSEPENPGEASFLTDSYSGTKKFETRKLNRINIGLPATQTVRYLKIPGKAVNVGEVIGSYQGKALDRSAWRATNLFADYAKAPAKRAWSVSFKLDEAAKGSYLVIPCNGKHGRDGAYASLRINGGAVGAPQRAKSYPSNTWDTGNSRPDDNLRYFFPITPEMIGKTIDAVVMQFESEGNPQIPLGEFTSEVWLTAYPIPYVSKQLVLDER